MAEELLDKYKDNIHNPKRPVLHQLVKVEHGTTFDSGYVSEIYDECYVIEGQAHVYMIKYDVVDENKVYLLHENGHPIVAKRNIFGKFKRHR